MLGLLGATSRVVPSLLHILYDACHLPSEAENT